MDSTQFKILENFNICTVIMPFYSKTHTAFLLLSSLSRGTRSKLNEFYREFVSVMKSYWVICSVGELMNDTPILPSHLFIYNLSDIPSVFFDIFIDKIIQIQCKKGYYFNQYFMHNFFDNWLRLYFNRL